MSVSWEISDLDGGLRVVTTSLPGAQSVNVNVFVGAGSRGESVESRGLAHFVEHMLFKGTARRPTAIDVAKAIEGAGGVLNAYTSKEITCYWNHVPFEQLELGIEVLADMVQNSLLDDEEITRERSVVQQEIKRTKDQPSAYVSELLVGALYGDHPLGWPTAGTEETVSQFDREDLDGWLKTWYGAQNIVISVAGNTEHDVVAGLVEMHFADGRRPQPPAVRPALEAQAGRIVAESRPVSQANLALGMPSLSRMDPDRFILMVLNTLLGRGMSSRLFKEVREERGLAYSVGSYASRHSDTGAFVVNAGVAPDKLNEAIRVIVEELDKLVQQPVGEDELVRARDYTVGSFRLSLETPMSLGQRNGENLLMLGRVEPISFVAQEILSVTAEDILRVARRLFVLDRYALAVIGPDVHKDALAPLLQR